jgi:hypothetical protein
MRHARLNTTEQYMAYAPRPELANQITRALDPESLPETVEPIRAESTDSFLKRLEEEIPAKWLREVERIIAESPPTDTSTWQLQPPVPPESQRAVADRLSANSSA